MESAGELELDLRSIVEWGDGWLATFSATKTKLLSFNRQIDPSLPAEMNVIALPEETSFRLLGLTFSRSMDRKPYYSTLPRLPWANFIGPSVPLILISSCICTNLPFGYVWSTVPISGMVLHDPMGSIC